LIGKLQYHVRSRAQRPLDLAAALGIDPYAGHQDLVALALYTYRVTQICAEVVQGDENAKLVAHRCRGSWLTELVGTLGYIRDRERRGRMHAVGCRDSDRRCSALLHLFDLHPFMIPELDTLLHGMEVVGAEL